MKVLFIDAFSGVSGDKTVASLLSLGADKKILTDSLSTLEVAGEFEVEFVEKKIMGISCLKFNVTDKNNPDSEDASHAHKHKSHHINAKRNLSDIINIINNSNISNNAKKMSISIFEIIGTAEAKVHNVPVNEIHFHEIGAIDSIVDIVSTGILIDQLKIDKVICSPVPLGSGFVKTAHGLLPVPAPATLEILKDIPVYQGNINTELTTPTGAGIVKYLAKEFSRIPEMQIESIGYGAGSKELEIPNFLRVYLGEIKKNDAGNDKIISIETNLDDCTPEQIGFLFNRLLEIGALDVYATPIYMKKNRPATMLTILCKENNAALIEKEIFLNSTTFGIRKKIMDRSILKREIKEIEVFGEKIKIKLGYYQDKLIRSSLEFESVKNACEKLNMNYNDFVKSANMRMMEITGN